MALTRYVNPNSTAGGDGTTNATSGANRAYASLSEWEAARQAVLADVEECICETGGNADTTQCNINGWTTTAAFYIDIKTSSGHRHAGKWDTAKYRLAEANEFNYSLIVSEDYVRVAGLQIEHTHANGVSPYQQSATAAAASSDIRITESILRTASTRTTANSGSLINVGSGKLTIRNVAAYKGGASGLYTEFGANAPTVDADNCTFAACGSYGVNITSGTVTLRNCYSGGNTTNDYNGTITRTTCAHSSANVHSGSTASVAHSTANFTNVTAGSEDYRLVAGSALLDVGTDLSATFTNSINGVTRPSGSSFDIGAAEYLSAVSPRWFDGLISQPINLNNRVEMLAI